MRRDADGPTLPNAIREITILDDRVVKRRAPPLAAIEHEKTRRARAIGLESGLFEVPSITSYDAERGEITFERIPDSEPIRTTLSRGTYPEDLLPRVGRSLAVVHGQLSLPGGLEHGLPHEWRDADAPTAFIHGDFTTINVQYAAGRDRLVILDWVATQTISESATRGPIYFDMGIFIHTMMFGRVRATGWIRRSREKADEFLRGYAAERGFDRRAFGVYLLRAWRNLSARHRSDKGLVRFALYYPALAQLEGYARSLAR